MSTEKSARQRAAEAGARGKSAKPSPRWIRLGNYENQNLLAGRVRLTDRQQRQLRRMDRRAA